MNYCLLHRLHLRSSHLAAACALAVSLAGLPAAQAAMDIGELGDGEFALVIWDSENEATYTLDLGMKISELTEDGQSDDGYQKFWTLDRSTDARLDKLLDLGSQIDTLRWAVVAVDAEGFGFIPGDLRMFFTLEHTVATGTTNPNYTNTLAQSNLSFEASLGVYGQSLFKTLNTDSDNADNTHGVGGSDTYSRHGSSFTTKGQAGYFENNGLLMSTFASSTGPAITNTIGSSSWFYFATTSSFAGEEALALDELDNLTHDGFWGLAEDTDGTLALSYTIEGSDLTLAQRSFIQAIGRTELNSGFSIEKLAGAAKGTQEAGNGFTRRLADDLGSAGAVSAVPEPSTYALMALGLGLVGVVAHRRRT